MATVRRSYCSQKRRVMDATQPDGEVGVALADDAASGGGSLAYEVRAFFATLPRRQRVALVHRMIDHLSYGEIASNLHCSEAAARANVYTALRALRNHFGDRL